MSDLQFHSDVIRFAVSIRLYRLCNFHPIWSSWIKNWLFAKFLLRKQPGRSSQMSELCASSAHFLKFETWRRKCIIQIFRMHTSRATGSLIFRNGIRGKYTSNVCWRCHRINVNISRTIRQDWNIESVVLLRYRLIRSGKSEHAWSLAIEFVADHADRSQGGQRKYEKSSETATDEVFVCVVFLLFHEMF